MNNEFVANSFTASNPNSLVAESYVYDMPNMVKIRAGKHGIPKKATKGSAGYDLKADLIENIIINPGETCLVSTGTSVELPSGMCAFILPRSGLALKKGITVPNSPGLIDSDYRGDICVILRNEGTEPFAIEDGDRIAQLMLASYLIPSFVSVDELGHSDRGRGGFGSTGIG